ATTGTSYFTNIKITEADNATYKVTLKPTGAGITVKDLEGAEIVLTAEDGTEKSVTVAEGATALEIGEVGVGSYTVSVYKSGVFVQQNADAKLTVTGNCEHEITFKSYITEWNFSDTKFQSDKYGAGNYDWYNGLKLTGVYSGKDGGKKYAYLGSSTSEIQIPVKQNCEIVVDYYEQKNENDDIATLGKDAQDSTKIIGKASNGDFTAKYTYSGEEGCVILSAATDFYVSKITINDLSPAHTVTVQPKDGETVLTDADLKGSVITFTDVNDADNAHSFTIGDGENEVALNSIELKDGEYKVSVYNSNVYVQKTTANLVVNGANVTCPIPFESYITAWNFSDAKFRADYTSSAGLTWYNGLEMTGADAYNNKYLRMSNNGDKVRIPVNGNCEIALSYYPNSNAKIMGVKGEDGTVPAAGVALTTDEGEGEPVNRTYEYEGAKGYVDIIAGGTTYLIGINITYSTSGGGDEDAETITTTFDPVKEGIATNGLITAEGSKFSNDYFEVVDGEITGKNGKNVELKNSASSSLQFTTRGKGSVTISANSTGGTNSSNLVLYKFNTEGDDSDNTWVIVGEIKTIPTATADTVVEYTNLNPGTYKVSVPSEDHDYGRGVRVSKIVVTEEVTPETVTVNIDAPDDAVLESLVFTCRETKAVVTGTVAEGKCVVKLNANYTYDIACIPTRYVVKEGALLEMGEATSNLTKAHSIKVESVMLYKLTGKIVGLDDTALNSAKITFNKPSNKVYVPELQIDKTSKTYEIVLESGVEYTIVTTGINDYELDNTASNNSDKISINSDITGRNITYAKKPVYKVTIAPEGATLDDLADANFKFTNLNEDGYVYNFTGTDDIELRDGTYSVEVSNSGIYVQERTSNLVVDGEAVTKKIVFNSNITKWIFSAAEGFTKEACDAGNFKGLKLTSVTNESGKAHAVAAANAKIEIPVKEACNVEITYYYRAGGTIGGTGGTEFGLASGDAAYGSTSKTATTVYEYTGGAGYVEVNMTAQTYFTKIELTKTIPYASAITVDPSAEESSTSFKTINAALAAVRLMERESGDVVTISIAPGNYEEMIVIDMDDVKLVNAAGENASIGLRNKGVDIDPTAVRITSYYGVGYNYYSMGSDYKWSEEVFETNKANGSASTSNPTGGGTDCYWNATVEISGSNVSAEGIIFENSFNQYISKKAAEDILEKQGGAKEGAVPRASMAVGDTTVQDKAYVERAAALGIANNCKQISFDNCKFIGRQDTLYGGTGVTASFYGCDIYGGTDYIFGGMTAVFAKCNLVFNTSEDKNDVGYITAAQQSSGRGYLMYNCHVTSTVPGVDTASTYTTKPGYFGRPWTKATGEAVFYNTVIDEVDSYWQEHFDDEKEDVIKKALRSKSLIAPVAWDPGLGGESALSQEYGTYEVSGIESNHYQVVDANGEITTPGRATWSTLLTEPKLKDGTEITVAAFLGSWNPFVGKDMSIVLPSDTTVSAPAAPTAIVTPEVKDNKVIKGAKIVLSAEMGAKVYYNVNKTDEPTVEEGIPYTGAIEVDGDNIKDNSITIQAIAYKYGKLSTVSTFTYTVIDAPAPNKPELTPSGGSIKLGSSVVMSAEPGAAIYYNIKSGKTLDEEPTLYAGGKAGIKITADMLNLNNSTVTIEAVAVMYGKTSDATSVTYNVIVNAPVADPKSGYQFPDGGGRVKLTADEDVTILYTMGENPKDPSVASSKPLTYDKEGSGIKVSVDTTIKAVAKRGSKYSEVVTLNYLVPLSRPAATPENGAVLPANARKVTLTADAGTTIFYTMGENPADPTDPDSGRQTYNKDNGIEVTENTTIKAVAEKDGRYSMVAVFQYTVSEETYEKVGNLTATVNEEQISDNTVSVDKDTDVTVKLASETQGVDIYYTLNESVPSSSTDKYDSSTGIVIASIKETTVVKAIAVKEGMISSDVLTVTVKVKGSNTPGGNGEGLEIILKEENYTYTGSAIIPEYTVTYDGEPLIPGIDYTVKCSNNIKVADGKAKITVTGKGNLSGKTEQTFNIKQKSLAENDESGAGEVEGDKLVVVEGAKATPVLNYNGKKLAANKDFEFADPTYKNKKDWSSADDGNTVTVKAKEGGSFKESRVLTIVFVSKAAQKNVKLVVKLDNTANKNIIYDGTPKKPKFTSIENKGKTKTLEEGVDYIVSYPSDITSAGKKTFTVTGISADCVGTVTKTYTIKPAAKDESKVKVALDGTEVTAANTKLKFVSTGVTFAKDALEVTYDGKELDQGVDYKIAYSANKKVGTAKYTVTGLGNYKGVKKTGQFTIEKAAMSEDNVTVIVSDVALGKSAKVYKSAPYVIENDTNTLLKASNYKVTYCSDAAGTTPLGKTSAAGRAYVKIEGKGGYDSSTSIIKPYEIKAVGETVKDLSTAKITFYDAAGATKPAKNFSYTG
ncbi:hypothetical protein HDR58_08630, partial [bacterium]|nr:hypothetical protein [bacterium]